jgi:hypothetical protein
MDKSVAVGRADGLFVKALGIQGKALDSSDLGTNERGTVLKILWAIRRPDFELSLVRGERVQTLLAVVG